jgi:2-amino-4-hydroxy-6-hydroxymethyldihydropteridine diphosphokinase
VSFTPAATNFASAAVSFSPNTLKATVYPAAQLPAGEAFTFSSNPSLHYGSQLVLGRQAEVQFSPAGLGWQFSDGTRIQGVEIKRTFEQAGKYQAWAIASYFVSYRVVGETAWQAVAGQISVLSNVLDLDVSIKIPAVPPKPPKLDKSHYKFMVTEVSTSLKPKRLLAALNEVENHFGRVRLERWAARTLDIDIITFGSELIETKSLIIPHPRAHERAFVLVPWAELDPEAVLPGHGKVFDLAVKLANQVWKFE